MHYVTTIQGCGSLFAWESQRHGPLNGMFGSIRRLHPDMRHTAQGVWNGGLQCRQFCLRRCSGTFANEVFS